MRPHRASVLRGSGYRVLAAAFTSALVFCGSTASLAASPARPAPTDTRPSTAAPDVARERSLAARVSTDRALSMVRALVAAGPRMGGTASGDRAADLVAAALREAGLAVELLEDPPRQVHQETGWTVALRGVPLSSAWPVGFSPSLQLAELPLATDASLPERDPGDGSKPLSGRALVTRQDARTIVPRAAALGASAVLTYFPADPNHMPDWAALREPRTRGQALPVSVFALSYRDGESLRAAASDPNVTVTLSLESSAHEGRPRTVLATLAGEGESRDGIVLVCAHGDSDSGGPGADDNASGEAALIEVARALSAAAAAGELPHSRPTVRFAVWGSEIHSSLAYVAAHRAELARHLAVLNFDQAGFGSERDALYFEGNDVPWNEPLLRTLESIGSDHAGAPGFWTSYTSNPVLGGTDMYAFLPPQHRGFGEMAERIPTTTVFSAAWDHPTMVAQTPGWVSPGWPEQGPLFVDYSELYHSSGDRPELTTEREPWNMERCARMVLLGIVRLMEGRMAGSLEAPPAP